MAFHPLLELCSKFWFTGRSDVRDQQGILHVAKFHGEDKSDEAQACSVRDGLALGSEAQSQSNIT